MSDVDDILGYWLGDHDAQGAFASDRNALWWQKHDHVDREITERFGALHARAAAGELADWSRTPRGRLAILLLLDQFSRHIHRGTPQAFAQDPLALRLALEGIAQGQDRALHPIERVFAYLPLEHAEDRDVQHRSVSLYAALRDDVAPEHRPAYDVFHDFAVQHARIVDRFGRFPHRNEVLGRPSTPEELAFLEQPGSSF